MRNVCCRRADVYDVSKSIWKNQKICTDQQKNQGGFPIKYKQHMYLFDFALNCQSIRKTKLLAFCIAQLRVGLNQLQAKPITLRICLLQGGRSISLDLVTFSSAESVPAIIDDARPSVKKSCYELTSRIIHTHTNKKGVIFKKSLPPNYRLFSPSILCEEELRCCNDVCEPLAFVFSSAILHRV